MPSRNWRTHALTAEQAGQADRDAVSRYFIAQTGRRRIVDKNNQNGLCVPYLHALFPDAHFVYVKRSPGDNVHSLIEGWGKADEFATWSADLPVDVRIEGGRYRPMVLLPVRRLAALRRRIHRAGLCRAVSGHEPRHHRRLEVDSGGVSGPKSGTRTWSGTRWLAFAAVFQACGLAFTPALQKHCAGVLSTPYNAFSEIRLDKWRDQANHERIERVLPDLTSLAVEMGYPA